MAEINVSIKGLREVRQELKTLQFELSQATDPEQMAVLSQRAGELRDNLARANEQAAVFSAGSPFEQTSNALGLMNSQLMSLDFEGAAESAKLFATAANGISPQLIATQLKSLGSVIGQVTKAFISMGASLLANPIFLIGAAIAALVAVIGLLLHKLGFLQPILDGIGKVFEWIMTPIRALIDGLKALTDWFGWTSHAAAESAEKQAKAAEKAAEAQKKAGEETIQNLENQIRMAELNGEETANLERQKVNEIRKTAEEQKKADRLAYEAAKIKGDLSEEELANLKETARQSRLTYEQAVADVKYFEAEKKKELKEAREEEKRLADERKKEEQRLRQEQLEKDREAYKQRLEEKKKFEEDRLNISRQIIDLQNELLEDGIQKELTLNKEKYARLIQDTLNNEILLDNERTALVNLLKEQEFENTKAIELRYAEELSKALKDAETARKEAEATEAAERAENEKAIADALLAERKAQYEKELAEQRAYTEARYALADGLIQGLTGLEKLLGEAGVRTAGLQKTIALVQIATDTAKAISSVVAGATAAAAAGGPAAPFLIAGYIASGIGTVASAIASAYAALKEAPSIGGGAVSGGNAISTASQGAQTPSFQLFGQNNNANNLTQSQSAESQSQNITVQAVVSETEITSVQKKVQQMQNNAEL